ncbi:glutathione S-transferase family protein [Synechococcus sp. CC9616]|uniref:glutathione S-transferase family protein n=1 Tax=Synechococcus sp. CC9616 TaxID=110663 RepID=UPI00048E6037|nr:glutathione S-transferase family protein [Synechococcus sp. CC9616]RPF82776.1 MAG: glutathione S-transferase family protein [Synechococcus sp. TMED20]
MLELHQFRHSAFCLKVRMVLQAKGLSYRTVEVTPGIGQVAVFRLSGQRQVPVLVDGDTVLADSSTISRHLDLAGGEPALLPADAKQAAQVHLIEDWADTTLAAGGRACLVQAAALDPELRVALLPDDVPDPLRSVMGAIPGGWVNSVSELVNQGERTALLASLEQLAASVEASPWLVGETMTMADLAVAAQLSLLRFPQSAGSPLAGRGVPGLSDHPKLQALFQWRDQLELKLMERTLEEV